jgi:hypothetical protein
MDPDQLLPVLKGMPAGAVITQVETTGDVNGAESAGPGQLRPGDPTLAGPRSRAPEEPATRLGPTTASEKDQMGELIHVKAIRTRRAAEHRSREPGNRGEFWSAGIEKVSHLFC